MAKRSFKHYVEQELGKFPLFLIYAVLEWLLIIVLFIDGFLAFFANEFARFFELEIPCLLCTRIDHVLVDRADDFYYNGSVCQSHKKELSCLAYCHSHKKLSDIRKMCETCLLSFATEKATDCYTYKSLVGILHKDIEMFVDNDQDHHFTLPTARKDDSMHAERIIRNPCSCCGEPLKAKSYFKGKGSSMVSQAPTPSPRAPFGNLKNEDHRNMELPNMRFTELKFSDNESEPHEDDDGQNTSHVAREDVKAATVPSLPEAEYMNEDRTPTFARGNRFFGIPLTDSATCSPRWTNRIPRKSPLEKTELASESTEGSTVQNEGDGDLTLHHMKGQARLDRKSLMALYMELDEERNASAIAANNAMAMITRLQAEKASVQMEALQYQRMMEEQAEYDQEALQATNNLLRKRDEDINALEAELDEYRERYGLLREESFEGSGDEFDEGYLEKNAQSISSENISPDYSFIDGCINEENLHSNNQSSSMWDVNGEGTPNMLDKGGRSYLGRLKSLEKRIHLLSDDGAPFLQAISNNITHDEDTAQERTLMNELLQLHERVRALEDEEVSKHAAGDTTQSDTEREKLLTDICDNIQQLRQFISMPLSEGQDA
ncbi:probable myosin-binding protein 5 isoform X2 [Manihot esculenta]|uniref:GTD-binding domain-containing protein n=1 Tax=Manihot esculenta TaxID=3983 RepID=A0A2C9VRK6_MANES|nr:probable myosin-binding protein 5 isoform X2 [Manihot esculenta]